MLAEAFVRSDERFFEQADDSDGAIGDAIRAGCRLWLRAAKAQPNRDAAEWIDRVYALVNADEYGAREALLEHGDLLLDEASLRALAGRFEADLEKALHARGAAERRDHAVYKAAAAIGLIADALRAQNLAVLDSLRLDPETLARTGMHPELGRVTLAQLLASWVVHDIGHLAQISRVLAKRYGGEVGPWREYSPILDR